MTGSDTLIYRLLFNLTENAIRYNRPNGTVCISIAEEETQIVVRVADSGCGIPEEYRRSIFQPFFRVDKSRSRAYGGVGLGLSLVWEIARLHGGEVLVEKARKKARRWRFAFPAEEGIAAMDRRAAETRRVIEAAGTSCYTLVESEVIIWIRNDIRSYSAA